MNDRFIRLSISLARLQKVIQRIKASGMSRIELKAGHTLVLCRLAAVSEGLHFSELTERCGLDPAMISRVLAELVRSGLVEKRAESGKYNALYLLTRLLLSSTTRIGVENPCFREAINTFLLADAEVVPHPVDEEGIVLNERPCDYYYVTPGHQVPTGVTMSSARRRQLLEHAARHDAVIIEDDYDSESNFTLNPLPALKASDRSGRVVYVSSLSKALSPGLRLGFMVADPDLIDEARALRRLVYRHPPTNIQYQMAHFLAQGHYETHLRRYHYDSAQRWERLHAALQRYLPSCRALAGSEHANAFWLQTPAQINTQQLTWRAAHAGALLDALVRGLEAARDAGAFGDGIEGIIEDSVRRLNPPHVHADFMAEFG